MMPSHGLPLQVYEYNLPHVVTIGEPSVAKAQG